jgi:hypothetical protein
VAAQLAAPQEGLSSVSKFYTTAKLRNWQLRSFCIERKKCTDMMVGK